MNEQTEKNTTLDIIVYFCVCLPLCILSKKIFKRGEKYNPLADAICMTCGKIIGDALYEEMKKKRKEEKALEQ